MYNLSLGGGAGGNIPEWNLFHPVFLASAGESFAAGA